MVGEKSAGKQAGVQPGGFLGTVRRDHIASMETVSACFSSWSVSDLDQEMEGRKLGS